MKLKEIIENELGLNYMELIRNSESPREIANESTYYPCELCNEWEYGGDFGITSGQDGVDICEDCMEAKPKNEHVISAKAWLKKYN